jgi:hypothetical protein
MAAAPAGLLPHQQPVSKPKAAGVLAVAAAHKAGADAVIKKKMADGLKKRCNN